jgi:uncharacterized protein (TIGR02611 family)
MNKFTRSWQKVPRPVRKPLVFMLGFAVVAAGVAMLALPGPGWAAIFLGFAILATEFAFAEKVRDWLVANLKRIVSLLQKKWRETFHKSKR